MARTKLDATPAVELPPLDGEALTANQNSMSTILASHSDDRDLINQLLGQAQMADAFGKFSQTVWASKLAYVKEHKLYRALQGKSAPNGLVFSGTWSEFCSVLGVSDEKANQDIANLRTFGEEALESMSRMGIGYREMRQYRRLPEDHQAALIEVAKTGDKEAFIDLAEEIIAKHAKEKEALTQRLDEANADYDAQGEVMAKKAGELDQVKMELEKVRRRVQTLPVSEVSGELRQEVTALAYQAEASILGSLREGFTKLAEHAAESGEDHRAFKATVIRQLELTLATVLSEFHLNGVLDDAPAWLNQAEG